MRGDELGRWFDEHAPALVLYARQWCETPEDVVQEAFLQLARQGTRPDSVAAWLFRAVRNGAINAGRGDRNRKRREARGSSTEAWFRGDDDRIDALEVSRRLAELDPEHREAIVARFWGGLTFEEIAALQGCSLTTAHRRYQAGLAALNARLGGPSWTSADLKT